MKTSIAYRIRSLFLIKSRSDWRPLEGWRSANVTTTSHLDDTSNGRLFCFKKLPCSPSVPLSLSLSCWLRPLYSLGRRLFKNELELVGATTTGATKQDLQQTTQALPFARRDEEILGWLSCQAGLSLFECDQAQA